MRKKTCFLPSRHGKLAIAAAVAVAGFSGTALAQNVVTSYFPRQWATGSDGSQPALGGFLFDDANQRFYTVTFNASQSIRQINTAAGNPLSFTLTGGTWVNDATFTLGGFEGTGSMVGATGFQDYIRSTSLTDNGGNGTILAVNSNSIVGGLQLNPVALTIDGVTFAPGTVAIMTDGSSLSGTANRPFSKVVSAYDLRMQETLKSENPGWNRSPGTTVKWNDIFANIADRGAFYNSPTQPETVNMGRNFAFAQDGAGAGKFIYMTDSASTGGLWRVNLEATGTAAVKLISQFDASATEPGVLHTSTLDLDPQDATAGDQILHQSNEEAFGLGGTGSVAYINYDLDTDTASGWRNLIHTTQIRTITGLARSNPTSFTTDSVGNIYFTDGSSGTVYRRDPQGRITAVMSREQQATYLEADGHASVLDLRTRLVSVTNGPVTFDVTEVMFTSASGGGNNVLGALAFKPGDMNRDNVVNAVDTALFIQQYNRTPTDADPLHRDEAGYVDYLTADLNGSAVVGTTTGQTTRVVNDGDLAKLFTVINKVGGDINLDGAVDAADLVSFDALNPTPGVGQAGNWLKGDFNRDGLVDTADRDILVANQGATYTLEGFDPVARYVGGANGTWAEVVKPNSGNAAADPDSIVTISRDAGATVTTSAGRTTAHYLTVGNDITTARNTLELAAGSTFATAEGVYIKQNGELAVNGSATLELGFSGAAAALAVDRGGQLTGDYLIKGSLFYITDQDLTLTAALTDLDGQTRSYLEKGGTGVMTLDRASTHSGITLAHGGGFVIAHSLALQNSTYEHSRDTSFAIGEGITEVTLGGLDGSGDISLMNAAGQAVALTFGGNNDSTSFSGVLSGDGASITKLGTGSLTMSGSHTFTGAANLTNGQIAIDANTFATAQVVTTGGSEIVFGTSTFFNLPDVAFGSLAGDAGFTLTDTRTRAPGPGAVRLSVGANNLSTTYSGSIDGMGGLTKVGSGTLTLTGASIYAGATTIAAGKLEIDGSVAGTVVVNTDAALGGSGSIGGAVDVAAGGRVSRTAVNNRLRVGGMTLAANSVFDFELAEGVDNAVELTGGDFTGATGNVVINITGDWLGYGLEYTLLDWTDATDVIGVELSDFVLGVYPTYGTPGTAGLAFDGSTLTFTSAVPEPTGVLSIGLGALALVGRRRRRRRL